MNFNENLPEWHKEGIEPPANKKEEGWNAGDKPPAEWLNWLFNRAYKVFVEIRSILTGHDEAISDRIPLAEKGEPEGVATLDEEGQVPAEQLNNAPDPDLSNYAEKDGDYEDLRARATTKEDVGLKNVTDDEQATKIEFNGHLTNEMPHQFIDEKNNKTYVFGLRISAEGKPQIIYEEAI